jgi:hypothetical protein
MERMISLMAGLAFVFFDLGCGGGGSGGGGSGSVTPADLCKATCAREVRCEYYASESECQSACLAENGPMMSLLDAAFIAEAVKCYPDLSCEASDDPCISAAVMSVAPNGNKDDQYLACRSRLPECHTEDTLAVVCIYATVFNEDGRRRLQACLAKPCAEVGGCVADLTGMK